MRNEGTLANGRKAVLRDEGLYQRCQESAKHQIFAHLQQLGAAMTQHRHDTAPVSMMMIVTMVMVMVMVLMIIMAMAMLFAMRMHILMLMRLVGKRRDRVAQWIAFQEAGQKESNSQRYAKGESHSGVGHGRVSTEGHEGRSEHNRVQNRSDKDEDDGDIYGHSFVHETANEWNHAAFTKRKHNPKHTGEQDASERMTGRHSTDKAFRYEIFNNGRQQNS